MPSLNEVFGVGISVPKYTYVNRSGLDEKFKYLLSAERHIVIHGSSKQGKTILRKKNLADTESITVQCRAATTCRQLYTEILSQVGASVPTELSESTTTSGTLSAKVAGKVGFSLFAQAEAGTDASGTLASTSEQKAVAVGQDVENLRYVSEQVRKSGRRVVVEDFHYVPEDEKKSLAFDLKAFWDMGTFLMIVGVWAEQNLLQYYNGDLSGRIEEIDIQWNNQELDEVLKKGENALNMEFGPEIKAAVIEDSNQNVGLLQRIAEKYCFNCGVLEYNKTDLLPRMTNSPGMLEKARTTICHEEDSRYRQFGNALEKGFKGGDESQLKVYQHIARVCMEANDVELLKGLHYSTLFDRVQRYNPRVRQSDLTAALQRLNRLQEDRSISPLILSYNPKSRLVQLIDRELLFYRRYGAPVWPWSGEDTPKTDNIG
jgi:hypothetical protein